MHSIVPNRYRARPTSGTTPPCFLELAPKPLPKTVLAGSRCPSLGSLWRTWIGEISSGAGPAMVEEEFVSVDRIEILQHHGSYLSFLIRSLKWAAVRLTAARSTVEGSRYTEEIACSPTQYECAGGRQSHKCIWQFWHGHFSSLSAAVGAPKTKAGPCSH
jgi:hypothetical protein